MIVGDKVVFIGASGIYTSGTPERLIGYSGTIIKEEPNGVFLVLFHKSKEKWWTAGSELELYTEPENTIDNIVNYFLGV